MNSKEWAEKLNNIEYPADEIWDMRKQFEEDGVVVVYGASDDLIEFEGVISDEGDCYNDKVFYINKEGLTTSYSKNYVKVTHPHDGTAQFEYETNIPCEWFNVVEDGELYCKGFVFNINDLKG